MIRKTISAMMAVLLLVCALWIPCAASEVEEPGDFISETGGEPSVIDEGGESGGDAGGESGGESGGGESGGSTGGETGGESGGSTGGETGGETGGSTGGETGGETGGSTGGETGGETGGSTGGETGGETGGSTGGETGGETGGSTGGETGGEIGGETGGETGGNVTTGTNNTTTTNRTSTNKCQHEFPDWQQKSWAHVRTCKKCKAFESVRHVYTNRYMEGDKGHWLACDECGYHEKKQEEHSFGDTYVSDAENHWHACALCGAQETKEAHVPGPEADETQDQICTVCEYVIVPKLEPAPTETVAETVPETTEAARPVVWAYNDSTHWLDDGTDVKQQQSMHKWDSGKQDASGSVVYTCSTCQATRIDDGSEAKAAMTKTIVSIVFAVVMVVLAVLLLVVLLRPRNSRRY